MEPARLAALVSSRLCHDLVSPVSALNTALELMDGDSSGEMRAQAMDLITTSTRQATAKLKFFRLAFGAAAGVSKQELEFEIANQAIREFFAEIKPSYEWTGGPERAPKAAVRLLMNMCLLAADCLPFGGKVEAGAEIDGDTLEIAVIASGQRATLKAEAAAGLSGEPDLEQGIDARSIQPLYARFVADEAGATLEAHQDGESVVMRARVPLD